jgi:hypothetical protein
MIIPYKKIERAKGYWILPWRNREGLSHLNRSGHHSWGRQIRMGPHLTRSPVGNILLPTSSPINKASQSKKKDMSKSVAETKS